MSVILGPFLDVIALVLAAYFNVVLIEVVLHWLLHFGLIKLTNKYTVTIMNVLERMTEPVYRKIKEFVPVFNGVDFSPFILLLGIYFLESLVYRLNQLLM